MKLCQQCNKPYKTPAKKFCSVRCMGLAMVGHENRNTGRTHFKKGFTPWNKGRPWSQEIIDKMMLTKRLRPPHKVVLPTYNQQKGAAHWNWKGGVTPKHDAIRKSRTIKKWREAVFKRDDYTCQKCGIRGGVLHADHVLPFSLYPEMRFDTLNGQTLCISCHKATPTYGPKLRWNIDPLELFLATHGREYA